MATFDFNWWNIYLTLNEAETKDLESAADVGAKITALVSDGLAKAPGLSISDALTALAKVFTAYMQIEKALVVAVDQGNGVELHIPWLALSLGQFWFIYPMPAPAAMQQNWRWCSRCSGLFWPGPSAGMCPAGGTHGPNTSSNYRLVMDVPSYQGQHDWRFCNKCSGFFWAGGQQSAGRCPAGGTHSRGTSSDYAVIMNDPSFSGQHGWRFCGNCSGLFWLWDAGATNGGSCPAGGVHVQSGTTDYALMG
jgi:hypothetical protein